MLVIVLLVISLGIHEAAHGWVALKCGDTTARDLGRITLNPLAHIDPFMTIILPVMMFYFAGFMFGGAKPVPVNFYNLRRPYRDMALVALAGPVSNFLLAILFTFAYKALVEFDLYERKQLLPQIMLQATFFNLLLAAFNLIPVPPLDGSRILTWLLPANIRVYYQQLERFGMLLIFLLIFMVPGFGQLLFGMIDSMWTAVRFVVGLGGLW